MFFNKPLVVARSSKGRAEIRYAALGKTYGSRLLAVVFTVRTNAKKTEDAGPKKGRGAFYGARAETKKASNRRRAMHPRIVARLRRQLVLLEFADSRPIEDCVGQFLET